MSILLNILVSASGCLLAILVFVCGFAIYDCIYEIREEKKREKLDEWERM